MGTQPMARPRPNEEGPGKGPGTQPAATSPQRQSEPVEGPCGLEG